MSSDLVVEIKDREVKRLMERTPKIFNSEFNRGFTRTAGAFFRRFAKERLRKGGIRVRRRIAKKKAGGGISVPVKARALGFRGVLAGRSELEGKVATMGTSNPIAVLHETGGEIRPHKGRYLFVRVGSIAAARRAGVKIKRGQKPRVIRVRKVIIKPRLGFMKTWDAFIPEAKRRLGESLMRAAQRALTSAKGK